MPSVILRYIRQRIKTQPISLQNQLSNQCPNFAGCLAQFLFIFGGFWDSNWLQNPSQVDEKIDQRKDRLLDRVKIDFCSITASNLGGPGGPMGVRPATFWPLEAVLQPRWAQDPPELDF